MKSHNIKYIFIGAFFAFTCCIIALSVNAQIFVGSGEGSAWVSGGGMSNNQLSNNLDMPGYQFVGKTANGEMVWERLDPGSTGRSTPKTDDQNPDITNTDANCAVKSVGEDYIRCCKDEEEVASVETCESKGYYSTAPSCSSGTKSSSFTTTLNGQSKTCYKCILDTSAGTNSGGCGTACYTNCSKNGGSVYESAEAWHKSGGVQIAASGCNSGNTSGSCYCVKGASSGQNTSLIVAPGAGDDTSNRPNQYKGEVIR